MVWREYGIWPFLHDLMVDFKWVVFHTQIIPYVLTSLFPINEEVFLFYQVIHPIKVHIHSLGPLLSNSIGDDAFDRRVICFNWGFWLGETEFVEFDAER